MSRPLQHAVVVCLAAVTGALLWGGIGLNRHAIAALDAWAAAAPNIQPTLDAISGPRGTLHEVNKAVVAVKAAVITTQIQERALVPHTLAAVDSLATIAPHANAVMDSAARTADAATGLTVQATATLRTVNDKAGPLMDAYAGAGRDLDAMIAENRPSVKAVLVNFDGMTLSGNTILGNAATVSTKAKEDYMKARTPWGKFVTTGLDLIHLGAYAAR